MQIRIWRYNDTTQIVWRFGSQNIFIKFLTAHVTVNSNSLNVTSFIYTAAQIDILKMIWFSDTHSQAFRLPILRGKFDLPIPTASVTLVTFPVRDDPTTCADIKTSDETCQFGCGAELERHAHW